MGKNLENLNTSVPTMPSAPGMAVVVGTPGVDVFTGPSGAAKVPISAVNQPPPSQTGPLTPGVAPLGGHPNTGVDTPGGAGTTPGKMAARMEELASNTNSAKAALNLAAAQLRDTLATLPDSPGDHNVAIARSSMGVAAKRLELVASQM